MSNIHWRVHFDGSLQRKEIPEIPADAIREALINSFCHKDYGACQSNEVAIYKDRVEIYNPGSFPEGYKPEDFISGDERPVRRNPLITSILYYSKDVESFGTGLKRIADACNEANCRFAFKIMKSGFVVVFSAVKAATHKITHKSAHKMPHKSVSEIRFWPAAKSRVPEPRSPHTVDIKASAALCNPI